MAGFAERFARDAQALAQLSHPHIVTVHDFGYVDGPAGRVYYIVMEYIDGANLRQLLRTGGITPEAALAIVPQLCDALQFAHDEGIVHRDIKPENILIDRKGRVKIADFGLAKLTGRAADRHTLTAAGGTMGTVHYMAPEQMAGAHEVDHRADIYSLGVVFYELLTGEVPMGHFDPPSKKVQVDVRLDEVVLRSLAREPSRRYQHASEVKTEVEQISGVGALYVPWAFGREYKSPVTLFGLPLVHFATGIDPRTGRKRIAKGIVAVGDVAVGAFAIGGLAFGGVAIGGGAVGLLSLGGMALGFLAALGGLAVGGVALGGMAVGGIAVGGGAVGLFAFGGGAFGVHAFGANAQDPAARALAAGLAHSWPTLLMAVGIGLGIVLVLLLATVWLGVRGGQRGAPSDEPGSRTRRY